MKLTIHGEPRTKKTSNELAFLGRTADIAGWLRGILSLPPKQQLRALLSRVRVVPSKKYRQWLRKAVVQFRETPPLPLLDQPWNCKATIYRSRRIGDLIGYEQAVADFLQDKNLGTRKMPVHILTNDKWIQGWDGSRLEIDKAKPRVEVELTPMEHTIDLMETLVDSLKPESKNEVCPRCRGSGHEPNGVDTCAACNGTGKEWAP